MRGVTGDRWPRVRLGVILASAMIGVMGVSLLAPVLPTLRGEFGVTDSQVGLIITVYTLPGIVLTPFVGLAADRLGRRRTLIPLLFCFGIAGAAIAGATTFQQVLALRFIQGVGASALITLAFTLIGDYYTGDQQSAYIGLNSSAIGTGAAIYPLIGGMLAGIRWNVPFLFFGVSIIVGIIAVLVLDEPDFHQPEDLRTYGENFKASVQMPAAIGVYLADFAVFFLFYGGILTAVPLLLTDEFGVTEPWLGLLLAIVSVTNAIVAAKFGAFEDQASFATLIAAGFCLFGVALLGINLVTAPLHVAAVLVVFGVGFGIVMPTLNTVVVTLVSGQLRATMLAVQTSMLRIGQTAGPVAFTVLAERYFVSPVVGYRVVLPLFGIASIILGICGWLVARRIDSSHDTDGEH